MSRTPPGSGDQARTKRAASPLRSRPVCAHRRSRVDFDGVNRAALSRLPAILQCILPGGRREGHEYVALNPRRGDRHLGSFKINLKTGVWADFSSGDKGSDPVSLIAFIENCRQGEAAVKLGRMLGIDAGARRHG
jgi:hypothetical protein